MARAYGSELRGVCEAFRSALRERIPLTRFRLDVTLSEGRTESFVLVDPEPIPRPDATGHMPVRPQQPRAAASVSIHDEDGAIGTVTVEHASRDVAANDLRKEVERVARVYAPAIRACLGGDATWMREASAVGGKRASHRRRSRR